MTSWTALSGLPDQNPIEIRRAVLEHLLEAARADNCAFYDIVVRQGTTYVGVYEACGCEAILDVLRGFAGVELSRFVDINPTFMTAMNRLVVLGRDDFAGNKMLTEVWEPLGIMESLGISITQGERFIGWLGAFRREKSPPYTQADVRRVAKYVDAYRNAIEVAATLEGKPIGDSAVVLVDEDGTLVGGSEGGKAWFDESQNAAATIRKLARSPHSPIGYVDGSRLRLMPITMETGSARYCLLIDRTEPWRVPAIAALTLQKRRIVEMACVGATTSEMARELLRSEETVRTHMKQIYQVLGVSSRIELREMVDSFAR